MNTKGFTLLEFLAASSLFLAIILLAYPKIDVEKDLLSWMLGQARPEEESNYRLLLIKNLLQDSGAGFHSDAFLERIPHFFPDLSYGMAPRPDAFSVARPLGPPVKFQMSGKTTVVCLSSCPFKPGDEIAMAGLTDTNEFGWNYARIKQVLSGKSYVIDFELNRATLLAGSLIPVDINGFLYQKKTLYCVTAGGALQPFFGSLETLHYDWSGVQLKVRWEIDSVTAAITVTL